MSDARGEFLKTIESTQRAKSLRLLANCQDPDVAEAVVLNPYTDTETLEMLLNHPEKHIRELAQMALIWRKPPRNSSGSPRKEEERE